MPHRGFGEAHEASLYRTLVRNLPEYGIFRIGIDGRMESWNHGIERILGYTEPEFLGLEFAALFLPEDREQDMPEYELRTAAQEGRASDRRWHLRKDGIRIFCDGVVTPILGNSGQLLGFTKVMQDITQRKLVEQENAELAHALDLTHTIIRDFDGTILTWTQGAEFLYGWSREEALGHRTHDLLKTHFPEPFEAINERLLELGEWQGELLHETKDGRRVAVASHWVLHAPADDLLHVIEVNNDISEMRGLQEELEATNGKLQRANAELTSFAYEVAHDIQSPLRGLSILAEFLSRRLQSSLPEQDQALLGQVVADSRKLRTLVDSLLEYATLENAPDHGEWFPLEEVLHEVRAHLGDAIATAHGQVEWGPLPVIRSHRVRILRLLQNLISNALKYARPGVPPVIQVQGTEVEEEWRIDVIDNGRGIAPENIQQLFLPLKRFHGTEIAGTGLGLAIAKRIVEGEGGHIWVDSIVGQGSVFHIALPIDRDTADQQEST